METGANLNGQLAAIGLKPSGFEAVVSEVGDLYARFRSHPMAEERPVEAEVSFEDEVSSGITLKGRIDAVYGSGIDARIVDWKTGGIHGDDVEASFRAKLEAASVAMAELIVPGTLGILTDVAGLLVILVTTIPQMRNLGIFGAFWVAAIVFTVEILHPVLICSLPPPREHRHHTPRLVVRFTEGIAHLVTHPTGKWMVAGPPWCSSVPPAS